MLLPRLHSLLYLSGFARTEPPAPTNTETMPNWRTEGLLLFFAEVQNITFLSFRSFFLARSETRDEMQFLWIPQLERWRNNLKHTHVHFPGNIHFQSLERVGYFPSKN